MGGVMSDNSIGLVYVNLNPLLMRAGTEEGDAKDLGGSGGAGAAAGSSGGGGSDKEEGEGPRAPPSPTSALPKQAHTPKPVEDEQQGEVRGHQGGGRVGENSGRPGCSYITPFGAMSCQEGVSGVCQGRGSSGVLICVASLLPTSKPTSRAPPTKPPV